MVGCSRSYCIFPNALVMQFYDTQSVTNIDFTSKTNNSWYKSPITAWKIPFERYDSYLSPNKKKQTHYPFFHIYFNGFLPPFNFLLHPWTVAYTDNILSVKVFLFRYFVFYGVACLLASIDGTETPEIPKCTSLVYLYSDMWRSFDVGLYNYIHRYVG